MPSLPDTPFFSLAPDWACEVLSPSTAALDRARKLEIYAREGIPHCWLVDPAPRILEVLRLDAGRWSIRSTHAGGDVVSAEPFAEIEIALGDLWPEG